MQEELNAIAWKPDIRPRKMHGSRAPLQGYNDLLTLAPMPDSAIHQSVLHLTLETAALPDSMLHKAIRRLTPSPHLQAFSRPCSAILLVLFAGLCFMGVALAEEMSSTVQAPSTDGATTAATATPPPPGVPSGMANAEAGATTEPTSREGSPAPPGTAMTSPSMPPKNVDLSKEIGIPSSREDAAQGKGFGYETFSSGGLPINQGPVDDLYLLSPGDEIVVSIWGQLVETLNLVVSDEGFIDLPDNGGRIQTNGVTLRDLKPKVVQALSQIYAAYINAVDPPKSTAFVDIRVGKLRKLSILVVGEVNKPGAYTVSAGVANVINMLHNAGGVKTGGSLREIRIRRSNGKVDTVDLYGFLLTGDIDYRTIRLQPGDYIVVPLKQRSVTIEGEVRRPNQYEMIGNEGIRELLKFAGGFTPDAYLRQTQIKRYELNRGEIYLDVDLDRIVADPHEDYPLMDGDVIRIARNVQVRKNVVSIKGDGIIRPGTYEWQPGMTLNDLVQKAEGLREYAFLDRADLIRTENDFSKKLTVISLKALYTRNVSGNFDFSGNQGDNIPLREMDEVIIQSAYGMAGKERFVAMEGHVKEAGKFVLAKDMTLYDLIFARGGFQDAAFRKATFLDMG
ncbi:SLBB domain-containing protein, partial [Methyloparacoccus murrellii]